MSDKEIVAGVLSRLPEDMPLDDIMREIEFLAGIEVAREQVRRGDVVSEEEMLREIDSWFGN